ncbi:MAG: hypothetical protein CM1200mP3_17470 [Chloroflexota bacterium]|nr:MAG: hypothetical protein CM1200mP3_17470 [Chloroflexota bacterium]
MAFVYECFSSAKSFFASMKQEKGFAQTIDEAVPLGTELFENTAGKKEFNKRRREDNEKK